MRRAARLVPALLVMLAVVVAVKPAALHFSDRRRPVPPRRRALGVRPGPRPCVVAGHRGPLLPRVAGSRAATAAAPLGAAGRGDRSCRVARRARRYRVARDAWRRVGAARRRCPSRSRTTPTRTNLATAAPPRPYLVRRLSVALPAARPQPARRAVGQSRARRPVRGDCGRVVPVVRVADHTAVTRCCPRSWDRGCGHGSASRRTARPPMSRRADDHRHSASISGRRDGRWNCREIALLHLSEGEQPWNPGGASTMMRLRLLVGVAVVALVGVGQPATSHAEDSTCFGRAATIVGTQGDDSLMGTAGSDVIVGLRWGNDLISGLDGDDYICAGDNFAYLKQRDGQATEQVDAGPGDDRISGGPGGELIHGGPGSDVIFTNGGAPPVTQADEETAMGNAASGDEDNDRLVGGTDGDILDGGPGDDSVVGRAGNDAIGGKAGHDRLRGMAGNDWLYGGGRRDVLLGGQGLDRLFGGPGRDYLAGGAGPDVSRGEGGVDTCVSPGADVDQGARCERWDPDHAAGGSVSRRSLGPPPLTPGTTVRRRWSARPRERSSPASQPSRRSSSAPNQHRAVNVSVMALASTSVGPAPARAR